jgi:hypothetical protein
MARIEVACFVDIEQTPESLHAHAIPEDVDLQPGDRVIVHGAPTEVRYGDRIQVTCAATVIRAGSIRRAWTRLTAFLELLELFEAGFQPKGHA